MHTFTVTAENTSLAWIAACRALDVAANQRHHGFHTVVRIADAAAENVHVRADFDQMRERCGYAPIETVANTIFPARLAATSSSPEELVRRYGEMYERLRRIDQGNRYGTYFGRIVAYPTHKGPIDQLTAVIARIRRQAAGRGPMSAAYEMDVAHPDDATHPEDLAGPAGLESGQDTWSTPVHIAGTDNGYRGFPCLSHCSFQLEHGSVLHAVALYRSHYMVDRAYGNYLGLGRLLAYMAQQAQVQPGSLTVIAGHAQIEKDLRAIRPLIAEQAQLSL
ncbi:hypothetical protein ACFFMN_12160 [Planobispora siamensis]|uniref:Thymidylate synthase n=1 Tax=Planobispora siamensis TaxID=936338 RepID=A0A8J3SAP9_9ACTN|nr:hypothetical protein [Planobispora siamensis]GIH89894.1 hypothetical protein Psi01_05240 [Planobispora siamensis]